MELWIRFDFHDYSPSGKTKIWEVSNIDNNQFLGYIEWTGNFRKYSFFPESNTYYDSNCLRRIADFLDKESKEHLKHE